MKNENDGRRYLLRAIMALIAAISITMVFVAIHVSDSGRTSSASPGATQSVQWETLSEQNATVVQAPENGQVTVTGSVAGSIK